ncbi:hypothetical protein KBD81_06030 [Candidatus Woesebacteria bacterium]|nr:hypothetical protein [Candidatus Woesebacteria bacterium]
MSVIDLAQLPQNLSANASQEESRWTEIVLNGTQFVPSKLEIGWGKAFYIKNNAKDTSIQLYSVPAGLLPEHHIPYLELYSTVATTPGTYKINVKGIPSAQLTLIIGPKAPVAK